MNKENLFILERLERELFESVMEDECVPDQRLIQASNLMREVILEETEQWAEQQSMYQESIENMLKSLFDKPNTADNLNLFSKIIGAAVALSRTEALIERTKGVQRLKLAQIRKGILTTLKELGGMI